MSSPVKSYIEQNAPLSIGTTAGVGHSMDYYREVSSGSDFPEPKLLSAVSEYVNTYSANNRSTTTSMSSFYANTVWGFDIIALTPGATYWQSRWAIHYQSGAITLKVFGGSDDGSNFSITINSITQVVSAGENVSWTDLDTSTAGYQSIPISITDNRLNITKNLVYFMPNRIYTTDAGYIQQYLSGGASAYPIKYEGQRIFFGPGT